MTYGYLVDSHCHLNYGGLAERESEVLANAKAAGIGCMLAINTKLREFDEVVDFAVRHDHIFATVGIHPHEAENEPNVAVEALVKRAQHTRVVGIGETGLDYYYDNAPRDLQKINFLAHIEAARQTGLPVIIHTRDADEDCANILEAEMAKAPFKALIHCFTASQMLADRVLALGLSISISGIVTFKNAQDLRDVVENIPMDKLLVETDSPFLAPVPHRGKKCEPAFTRNTAEFIADLKGISYEQLRETTSANFFRLFDKAVSPASWAV